MVLVIRAFLVALFDPAKIQEGKEDIVVVDTFQEFFIQKKKRERERQRGREKGRARLEKER